MEYSVYSHKYRTWRVFNALIYMTGLWTVDEWTHPLLERIERAFNRDENNKELSFRDFIKYEEGIYGDISEDVEKECMEDHEINLSEAIERSSL